MHELMIMRLSGNYKSYERESGGVIPPDLFYRKSTIV